MTGHSRVAVAISGFHSDPQVIALLDQIVDEAWPVEQIIVVESLGSGAIARYIEARGLAARVHHLDSPVNLGSAGNLQKRLELATALGMDFVLALNHDAAASRQALDSMLAWTALENIGALYPLRYHPGKRLFDLTGELAFSFRARGPDVPPAAALVDVYWSSSNGALYATAPIRERGLKPDGRLWMGWEDYLYGFDLHRHGYRQCIVTAARTVDDYEYRHVRIGPRTVTVADKPAWYLYYSVRNRISIDVHRLPGRRRTLASMAWAAMMLGHALRSRTTDSDAPPLSAYLHGLADGLRDRVGKWRYP